MSGDGGESMPQVRIELDGDVVRVNGEVVEHDGTRSVHEVAIATVTERFARALGRTIQATAVDATGQMRIVVHPDGTTSDVEILEEPPPALTHEAEHVDLDDKADVVAGGQGATVVLPERSPAEPRPRSGESGQAARRRSRALLAVVAVGMLGALGTGGVLVLTGGADGQPAPARTSDAPTAAPSSAPVPAVEPTETAPPSVTQKARVRARADVNKLELRITAVQRPTRAVVVVDPAGPRKPIRRVVTLNERWTTFTLTKIPPGRTTWKVRVTGAEPVAGAAHVAAPPRSSNGGTTDGSGSTTGGSTTGGTSGPGTSSGGTGSGGSSGGGKKPRGPKGINDNPPPGPRP